MRPKLKLKGREVGKLIGFVPSYGHPEVARGVGDGVVSKTLEATIVLHVVCIDNACSAVAVLSEINREVSLTTDCPP